jgi:diaminopimelate decarboxylase
LDERTILKLAKRHGTPLLIGKKSVVRSRFRAIQRGLSRTEVYYAVKANSDRALLTTLHEMGAGFDVASEGECERTNDLFGSLKGTVFSNPSKTERAIDRAYHWGCRKFVFDCQSELDKLVRLPADANLHLRVAVPAGSCRVNLSQRFGATIEQVELLARQATLCNRAISGIAFHVGSQAESAKDFEAAFEIAATVQRILHRLGHNIDCINIGGGFPVDYGAGLIKTEPMALATGDRATKSVLIAPEASAYGSGKNALSSRYCWADYARQTSDQPAEIIHEDYFRKVLESRKRFFPFGCSVDDREGLNVATSNVPSKPVESIRWMTEPGRFLVAEAVTLITSIIGVKTLVTGKPLYTIDDGIYGSFSGRYFPRDHFRFFLVSSIGATSSPDKAIPSMVCGPSCDGGDVLAESQLMPTLPIGSLLQVPMMGAYTSVGASRFNGLPIAKRIWIE